MVSKASLKKINDIIQWILAIAMVGMVIYYFFISKDIFKGRQQLIIWGYIGTSNASFIIDSKYFKENFSWKNNRLNIMQVSMCIMFFVAEILWI
jgi:hypothetical protein